MIIAFLQPYFKALFVLKDLINLTLETHHLVGYEIEWVPLQNWSNPVINTTPMVIFIALLETPQPF